MCSRSLEKSELFVQDLFASKYQIELTKIPESDEDVKTPDFEYIEDGERIFVAELKNFVFELLSEKQSANVVVHEWGTEATAPDNGASRVAQRIYDAYKQLKTYDEPKVLILLNDDSFLRVQHLEEAYTGFQVYSNDEFSIVHRASERVAEGRVADVKDKIDLYVWIDRHDDSQTWFRITSEMGEALAQRHLGMREK